MAVAYRNSAGNVSGTGTVVVSVPAGTVNGDLMIAVALRNSTDIPSLPAGWTNLGTANAGPAIRVCYRVASSEPANYSFVAAGTIAAIIATYSGAAATSFIDQFSAPNRLTSTTSTALSVTPSVSNCMLVYVAGEGTTSGAWTGPSGWNQRSTQSGGASVFLADLLQGAAAPTGNISATHATGNSYASLVAIAPATAASVTGAATLTATATLSVTGTRVVTGSVALTASSSLTAAGTRIILGGVSLAASGTLSAAGTRVVLGAASLAASGTLAVTGGVTILGSASLSATSTLTATGLAYVSGAAHLTAGGTLSVVGARIVYGEAHLVTPDPQPPVIIVESGGGGGPILRIDLAEIHGEAHLYATGFLTVRGGVVVGDDEEALRLAVELLL